MKTHVLTFLFAACFGAATLLPACGEKSPAETGENGEPVDGADRWSFNEVYAIFEARCVKCHADKGDGPAGGLALSPKAEAYANLVNKPAAGGKCKGKGEDDETRVRVKPENPEASLLLQKVKGLHDCGDRMPPANAPTLTAAQIDTIEAWISNGALNPP